MPPTRRGNTSEEVSKHDERLRTIKSIVIMQKESQLSYTHRSIKCVSYFIRTLLYYDLHLTLWSHNQGTWETKVLYSVTLAVPLT